MDTQQQNFSPLETIEEESEHEDETVRSRTGETEEEDLKLQVGVEPKEVLAGNYREEEEEEEEEDDDDAPLRVLRPGRRSSSISQKSFSQILSDCSQKETDNSQESDQSRESVRELKLGNEKRFSEKLRRRVSNISCQKPLMSKPSGKRRRKAKMKLEEPLPEWVVNLMVNIEEATTHQLVVE